MALNLYGQTQLVSTLLYPKLTQEIKRLREGGKRPNQLSVERSKLFDIIKKELNLNLGIKFLNDGSESVFIPLPLLNEDHPYFQRYRNTLLGSEGSTKIQKGNGIIEGGFDNKGRAFGFFAEVETYIAIGSGNFADKYTSEEIAAGLCHEIGHFRDALSALKFAFTANHIVSQAVNAYMNAGGREERIQLVSEFENAVGTVVVNKTDLVNSRDKATVTTVIVGSMKENGCSELNTPNLDYSQREQAADQFAVAAGAGDALATALSKRHGYYDVDRIPRSVYYSMDIATTIVKSTLFVAGGPFVQAAMLANVALAGSPLAREYDKGGERIARIRKALIVESKNSRLNKEEAQRITAQLEAIDKVEALYKDKTSIFEFFWTTLTPWGRRDKKQTDLVKLYENLLANELHAATTKLRSL